MNSKIVRLIIWIPLMLIHICPEAKAQKDEPLTPSALARQARADFAVPEAPAFKILDIDPSNILRPGNLREIAISSADLFLSTGLIPESFAVELAPRLLAEAGSLSLEEYRNDGWARFVYRFRISAAVSPSGGSGRNIGYGIRLTILDDTDLRLDNVFYQRARTESNKIREQYAKPFPENPEEDAKRKLQLDSELQESYNAIIEELRDKRKEELWNESLAELGIAGASLTPTGLARDISPDKGGIWGVYSGPMGGNGGWTIGGQAQIAKNSARQWKERTGAMALRGYVGSNSAKAGLEVDASGQTSRYPEYSVLAVGELNVLNGAWIEVKLGVSCEAGQRPNPTSSFNVRFATPE